MSDRVYLVGAEDVERAAARMVGAAASMEHAASEIAATFERHQRFMDDWIERFRAVLEEAAQPTVLTAEAPRG